MVNFNGSEENLHKALNISKERAKELEKDFSISLRKFIEMNINNKKVTKVDMIQYMSHLCININEYTLVLIWVLEFLNEKIENE